MSVLKSERNADCIKTEWAGQIDGFAGEDHFLLMYFTSAM
jgi:hypothetical protein